MFQKVKAGAVLAGLALSDHAFAQIDGMAVASAVSAVTVPVVLNPCAGGCSKPRDAASGSAYRQDQSGLELGGLARAGLPRARSAVVTRYQPSEALRRDALDGYVSRLRKTNPRAAAAVAEQFGRHDSGRIYSGIVSPFGLRGDGLADSMTAYTLLGWMVANGKSDPTPGQVAAVRKQVRARLAANPQFTNPANRGKLGEELKLLFVTLHSGWRSAIREGNGNAYADGVQALFQKQTGQNMRALRLTDQGFCEG
ncbi:MAG: hypothetical protein RQ833_08755 [Sphingomonadaceae bacterium]|nr:hypothetical protein [Sphingomonadaceae bacterium]